MPKRKRDEDEADEFGSRNSVKQRRVEHKLKLGATKLGHAFKIAKGFERQKLSRRRKNAVAQSNAKDVTRIDTEIEALKTLDTSSAAQQHLHKTLLKIKSVAEHPDLPPQVRKTSKVSSDAPTLNVIARLCKSNQGRTALDTAVADIQQSLGIDPDKTSSTKKNRLRENVVDSVVPGADSTRSQDSYPRDAPTKPGKPTAESDEDSDEYDSRAFQDRIALSEDDTGDEFSDVDDLEQRLLKEAAQQGPTGSPSQKYDVEADLSLSGSDLRSVSASPEPRKASTTKKTSFLPSLTMGGYISGSDSEVEDVDIAPKKNRRGQRARQQIWEQKYGSSAKHLQKESHATHYDPKRGAVDRNDRVRGKGQRPWQVDSKYTAGKHVDTIAATTKPDREMKKTHRDDGGALHPSWEAAKKAKEKKEAPVAFRGTKIMFD